MQVTATTNDGAGAPCWLSIAPLNTGLLTGTAFQATASAANLPVATHIGGLTVQAGGQTASDAIVFQNAAPGAAILDVGANPVLAIDPNGATGTLHVASVPLSSPLPFTAVCSGCAGVTLLAVCSGCPGATPGAVSGTTPVDLTAAITNAALFNPGQASITVSSPGAATVNIPITIAVPEISQVLDAAGGGSSLVQGEWASVYGNNLSAITRPWATADFNGLTLPTALSGVAVTVNGIRAPVYYVSPGQINVQVPTGLSGSVPVVVTTSGGLTTSPVTATVAANAPAIYSYPAGNNVYAVATHANGTLIGDPAVDPTATKANAGETIVIYVNGLAPSPSGTILGAIPYTASPVTVSFNSTTVTAAYAGVAFAGGFQVNVAVPTGLAAGDYALTVSTLGRSSQSGVILSVGP